MSGQSHTLRKAYQESEVVDIQAGRYQQSTIYKQEYSGTQMFTRSKCSRDLMGRFLIFAPKRHLDLSHVFTFPLTPVPLSLCYCDGTMAKTEKTALFRHLESQVESSFPSSASVDACVVDGGFLLRVYFLRIYPQRTAGSPQQSSFKQRRCQANVSTLSSTHTKCHQSK